MHVSVFVSASSITHDLRVIPVGVYDEVQCHCQRQRTCTCTATTWQHAFGILIQKVAQAPSWARAKALNALEVLAPEHDSEVLQAALLRLKDPEGMVGLCVCLRPSYRACSYE